ncbi:hypothetical protein [Nostoc sp.]|uniref:hypothetical protein n=1 Tax=Nostoc sp. TaxID=1180 RepID=UPI002FFCD918
MHQSLNCPKIYPMRSPLAEIVQALARGDRTCNTIDRKYKFSRTQFYGIGRSHL